MDIELMETDAELWVTKEYGNNNEDLKVEDLTEVYATVYTIKKKGLNEPEAVYAFTTDFEQAFKRFKLLPHKKCFLKRFLTDDEDLIKLAIEGTKPKVNQEDLTDEQNEISLGEIMDTYRDDDIIEKREALKKGNGEPIDLSHCISIREATEEEVANIAESK